MASDFPSAMTARSLRMVRTELEFLADASVITRKQLSSILDELPSESQARDAIAHTHQPSYQPSPVTARAHQPSPAPAPVPSPLPEPVQTQPVQTQPPPMPYSPPSTAMSSVSLNEKAPLHNQYVAPPPQPPPAYPQVPPILSLASAMYAYTPTDPGDLALQPNDRIQVIEHMNEDWWRGRNERTGMEGIFPRSYVNVINEKGAVQSPPPPTNYGNMPLEVSQSGSGDPASNDPEKKNKFEQGGKKFGKKLGNAAIFGAGATVGSNIVNSIF
ncbi:hypothetical protein N7532_001847 [Penicillium argentinense]|uniref:SH3 domain-containing protein n=1 Tax=Penicillium argentinense TaxID=1131581 RepID=A0A9W9G3D3_9EURO|nr:uncharacterized protein N7532_001847 [Penicillium argentinense]KAJ5111312.1 hypothetical protein N7532_001847 [Penicillium argentinense]